MGYHFGRSIDRRVITRLAFLVGFATGILFCGATAPTAIAEQPPIEGLAWMAGCWRGTVDEVVMEEHWMAPSGGVMLGLHRDAFPSGKVFFEYLRIVGGEDGISYIASPGGRESTAFALIEAGEHWVVFENPDHDFPRRITYRLAGEVLSARIDGEPGNARSAEWSWRRVDCAAGN